MTQQFKNNWLNALRSGKYQQGQNGLRRKTDNRGDLFCCLGVACDLIDPARWWADGGYNGKPHGWGTTPFVGQPPELIAMLGEKPYPNTLDVLIGMNDDENKTFSEIADWIEANIRAED